jgi:hypothetical protein
LIALCPRHNGSAYRTQHWRDACGALELRRLRTKAYTPAHQRQGRALHPARLREWAYAHP